MKDSDLPREHWQELSRLLDQALELPESARAAWIDEQAARNGEIGTILRRILARAPEALAADFLERPRLQSHAEQDVGAGTRIGPYRLLRALGEGGMGSVWLAERVDGQLERGVALKLPHAHLLAGAVRERFTRERDILARLQHPHIATLYDAGLADDGRPFLALEYVDGRPITDWCREHRASLAQRLDLMFQVMEAVEYAHARLVVHRDLKPANVLVTSEGEVKLLDFGIAKMLAGESSGGLATALTRVGQRMATPAYAAPEQVAGGAVTTRADVFALGAMLHELLCGVRLVTAAPTDHAAVPPPLCSSRIAANFAATMAGRSSASLRKELRGDLDAIVAKATEADPERRYASVEALAADLDRYRRHLPIEAQRIGKLRLAAKFVQRHRLSSALAAVLLGVSVLGATLVAWQAREAAQQARRAEAAKAFLAEIFSGSDPRIARDRPRGTMTARELLDIGAARIEKEFAADPATEIDLLGIVADIYRELGVTERANELEETRVRLARRLYGELSVVVVRAAVTKAAHNCDRQEPECATLLQVADGMLNRAEMNISVERAHWWVAEGERLRSLPDHAAARRAAYEKAIALYARLAPRDPGRVTAIEELASEQQQQGDYAGALSLHDEALSLAMALPRRDDAELQTIHGNRALALQQAGDLMAASAEFDQAADIAERTSGVDFETFWDIRGNAARTRHLAGDRVAADAAFDALMHHLPPLARHSASASTARELYGERLAAEGRPLAALPLLQAAEGEFVERPRDDFDLRRVRLRLGDALDRAGRTAEAQDKLGAALRDYVARSAPGDQPLLAMRERWGRFLFDQGKTTAAAAEFSEVVKQGRDRQWVHVALAHAGLARVALRARDVAAALAESSQALELWGRRQGFYDIRMEPYLQRVRADALALAGDIPAAQKLEDAAFAASEQYDAPESPTRTHRKLTRPEGEPIKRK